MCRSGSRPDNHRYSPHRSSGCRPGTSAILAAAILRLRSSGCRPGTSAVLAAAILQLRSSGCFPGDRQSSARRSPGCLPVGRPEVRGRRFSSIRSLRLHSRHPLTGRPAGTNRPVSPFPRSPGWRATGRTGHSKRMRGRWMVPCAPRRDVEVRTHCRSRGRDTCRAASCSSGSYGRGGRARSRPSTVRDRRGTYGPRAAGRTSIDESISGEGRVQGGGGISGFRIRAAIARRSGTGGACSPPGGFGSGRQSPDAPGPVGPVPRQAGGRRSYRAALKPPAVALPRIAGARSGSGAPHDREGARRRPGTFPPEDPRGLRSPARGGSV